MPISPGTKLGSYEITGPIGAGGMGEVYRARDTKLDRDVAIKVLPEKFAEDTERLARFEREAKLLASLNHPNIASIYGFEENALVLELVEGPTLADRIQKGPIPIEEALAIAKQIAEALEAGHEAGVVHRDLKPANVKVREDGTVKVLDYGLAKALEDEVTAGPESDLSQSPTLTRHGTQMGVILGTAAYMSPEQAKGKRVDKRTDIWAFGTVVYEMLTGKRAFGGEDLSETLASVIKSDPDWSGLPSDTPRWLRELLHRCLAKDRAKRLRDIGDALLEWDVKQNTRYVESESGARVWPYVFVTAILVGGVTWSFKTAGPLPKAGAVTRLSVNLPREQEIFFGESREAPPVAIAPDGRTFAYVATEAGVRHLYVRPLESEDSDRIDGTDGALSPFFSPDGEWVGFYARNQLWKVSLSNRRPVSMCEVAGTPFSASWGPTDAIVFTSGEKTGLHLVAADGGRPSPLTTVDEAAGELGHLWPFVAGDKVVYSIRRDTGYDFAIAIVDLGGGGSKVLVEGAFNAVVAPSGHLIYSDDSENIHAAPYDLETGKITGPVAPVASNVHISPGGGTAFFAISASGAFVYASTPAGQLVWVDRSGALVPLDTDWGGVGAVHVSPDGSKLAHNGGGSFVRDLGRGRTQLVTNIGFNPIWGPGSDEITFFTVQDGLEQLYRMKADGSGEPSLLLDGKTAQVPLSWSPDGTALIYWELHPESMFDLWALRADGTTAPFLVTQASEIRARFSPDGRFVAYESNESGVPEIYVRDFPDGERKWLVSSSGGEHAVWSREGTELFYRLGTQLMAVPVELEPTFRASKPTALFKVPSVFGSAPYDVMPGGERFVMVRSDAEAFRELHVVLNWFEELKRLVPTDN